MNKKMFPAVKKKDTAESKEQIVQSVVEVGGPKTNKWVVRRIANPVGYNDQYATIALENLATGKRELVTVTMYDYTHDWGQLPKGRSPQLYPNYGIKHHYMAYHGLIDRKLVPLYVHNAIDKMATSISTSRAEEKNKKAKAKKPRKAAAR